MFLEESDELPSRFDLTQPPAVLPIGDNLLGDTAAQLPGKSGLAHVQTVSQGENPTPQYGVFATRIDLSAVRHSLSPYDLRDGATRGTASSVQRTSSDLFMMRRIFPRDNRGTIVR